MTKFTNYERELVAYSSIGIPADVSHASTLSYQLGD